jgi:hypothetical protein
VKVTDSNNNSDSKPFAFQIYPILNSATASFHPGEAGFAYSPVTVSSTGGTGSYSWSLVAPNGLSISSGGVVSGQPAAAATTITVRVSDGIATKDTVFSVPIASQVGLTPATLTTHAKVGTAYSVTFVGAGGTGGYTGFTLTGGLPNGVTYNSTTHILAGTPLPLSAATYNFTITVRDNNVAACGGAGCQRTIPYTLIVDP